ncbi:MAG: hypothetical protein ACI4I1_03230 [Oscillospiraceae bacterium]
MSDLKNDLRIAKVMLAAQEEVIHNREQRERELREKAEKAFAERQKPKEEHKPTTPEERKAVIERFVTAAKNRFKK